MKSVLPVSVVIPTYRRETVLLETLDHLLALEPAPSEILVVDQTELHETWTEARLGQLHQRKCIRWIRLPLPSITKAMNTGLLEAREQVVVFVDDDIIPHPNLLVAHKAAQENQPGVLVAGRVVQPWDIGCDFSTGPHSQFAGLKAAAVDEFIGCNFSVRRKEALALGGFDENFVRVAYGYEAEFAHRFKKAGYPIYFDPDASLHHLRAGGGGTRTFADYLTTWKPDHAVGAYYCALRTKNTLDLLREFVARPLRAVATRHHLRKPWWIPVTLLSQLFGMVWALRLAMAGPRYAKPDSIR